MNRLRTIGVTAALSGAFLAGASSPDTTTTHQDAHNLALFGTCKATELSEANNISTPPNRMAFRLSLIVDQKPGIAATREKYERKSDILYLGRTSIVGYDIRAGRKDTHDTKDMTHSLQIGTRNDGGAIDETDSHPVVVFTPLKNHAKGDRVAIYLDQVIDTDDFQNTFTGHTPCGMLEHTGQSEQPWELHPAPDILQPLVTEDTRGNY